ncbi:Major facilitator superfamily domain, general substrate transporter [Pseudocohnilembus persalinus]|uniref:Major facilitator superfamily domain, general substrate transporter n=1 Tax=Pseudocohnilembus persalinus TaxID=266149 RepID=A0A0V0QXD6_PSEPJ|nr:Major facilitator superfamily domain, general substrate transporter [Pseudocohnilembus persalinus]|eukprot:KRX07036.1 Major facilitator superfamily domain, general substrate transporter [Pseudocohnilembus persalinus]
MKIKSKLKNSIISFAEENESYYDEEDISRKKTADYQEYNKFYKTKLPEKNTYNNEKQEKINNQKKDEKNFMEKIVLSQNLRWIILVLLVFSQMAGNVSVSLPAYFQIQLKQLFQINDVQYNLLFSAVNLPNIILPFVAEPGKQYKKKHLSPTNSGSINEKTLIILK